MTGDRIVVGTAESDLRGRAPGVAHLEPDGAMIDLRVTRAGWAQARQDFAADPAVPPGGTGSNCTCGTHPTSGRLAPLLTTPRQPTVDGVAV